MDFAPTDSQKDIRDLARKVFTARASASTLKAMEQKGVWHHEELWAELASTGLLGAALPEDVGGSGHGFLELCALLEEQGAAVAPVPLWASIVVGALPIAAHGTAEQKKRWLPGVVNGQTILTGALAEPGGPADDPMKPRTKARRDGATWIVSGEKALVPAFDKASRVLVPAAVDGDVVLLLVDPRAAGITAQKQILTSGEPGFDLKLADVKVDEADVLAGPDRGRAVLAWLLERATVALAAIELGVAQKALTMTAEYTTQRQQFDRPIATFQAVGQRAADAYIDVETIRLATTTAAWRLSNDLPASQQVAIAKYWAAEAGHRAVYAAQHLHGGIGFDRDYPLHRYYMWSRQLELTLGGATVQLGKLGAAIAHEEA